MGVDGIDGSRPEALLSGNEQGRVLGRGVEGKWTFWEPETQEAMQRRFCSWDSTASRFFLAMNLGLSASRFFSRESCREWSGLSWDHSRASPGVWSDEKMNTIGWLNCRFCGFWISFVADEVVTVELEILADNFVNVLVASLKSTAGVLCLAELCDQRSQLQEEVRKRRPLGCDFYMGGRPLVFVIYLDPPGIWFVIKPGKPLSILVIGIWMANDVSGEAKSVANDSHVLCFFTIKLQAWSSLVHLSDATTKLRFDKTPYSTSM